MLAELRIRDLAIIDEIEIGFSKGLNVLTGETGAGKSIIINAVNMLLGDRASEGLIRTGAKNGTVEALFDFAKDSDIAERIGKFGFGDSKEVLIKRTVASSGRSKVFINGELSTLGQLARIGDVLLSIYGQYEHQSLQKAETHMDLLDEFGQLTDSRAGYEVCFREMEGLRKDLADLKARESQAIRDQELMRFQSREIGSANLKKGEEEALKEQRTILANAEKLFEAADFAERVLYSDDSSVSEKLGSTLQKIREISKIDPSLDGLAKTIESGMVQLEEAAFALRRYRDRVECNPEELESVGRRFDEIGRLKTKYGQTIQEILQFKERTDEQLETLDLNRSQIEHLEAKLAEVELEAVERARDLSRERKKAAAAFRKAVEEELASLSMGSTIFEVRFGAEKPRTRERWVDVGGLSLGPRGLDTVDFYISPNVGEEARPLSRIASGGELSRIMLAMKRIIASAEPGQTLLFDEVDAGIGGAVAEVVGKKLKDLSLFHQILCVTHLPQIACFADVHHRVTKTAHQNRTLTRTQELTTEERVDEIARMLGGIKVTEKTRAHASEMIETAGKREPNLRRQP
jgi:DNA repair protein RecN (Recombination protein N)